MPLPNDIARCHDGQCGVLNQCRRWTDRNEGGTRVVHYTTHKPGYVPHHKPCDAYIGDQIEEDDE